MRMVLLSFFMLTLLCNACDDVNNDISQSSLDTWEYDRISYDDFIDKFMPGWHWYGIYDVFPDGSIGERNYTEIDGGSFPSFKILSDGQLKIYKSFVDETGACFTCSYGSFIYEDRDNMLTILNLDEFFTGGIVVSMTDDEMDMIAPLWIPDWSDERAVQSLFKFKKMTNEEIDDLDSISQNSNGSL